MTDTAGRLQAFDVDSRCAECGTAAAHAELIAPGSRPAGFDTWSPSDKALFSQYRVEERWRFIYRGIESGNGWGDDIEEDEAARLSHAFTQPLTFERVHTAGLFDDAGFCQGCAVPYCFDHWNDPARAAGTCPNGHWRSLDPHWSPS